MILCWLTTRLSLRRRRKELLLGELEEQLGEQGEPGAVAEARLELEEEVSRVLKGEWKSERSVVIHTFGITMQVTASLLVVCWVSLQPQGTLIVL